MIITEAAVPSGVTVDSATEFVTAVFGLLWFDKADNELVLLPVGDHVLQTINDPWRSLHPRAVAPGQHYAHPRHHQTRHW